MKHDLYNATNIIYNDNTVGFIYFNNELLWKQKANSKYTFELESTLNHYIYHLNCAKLFKYEKDKILDRIFIEYKNYNALESIKVVDLDLINHDNNIVYGELISSSSNIQINPKTEDKFIVEDKTIIVYDKFDNKLGEFDLIVDENINHILLDYENSCIYVFIEKSFDNISIYKYSYNIEVLNDV